MASSTVMIGAVGGMFLLALEAWMKSSFGHKIEIFYE